MAGDPLKKGRYTEYSNKIGLFDKSEKQFIGNSPEVVLSFPFKDAVLEAGMTKEDAGREERFLNIKIDAKDIDTLEDPKVLTNFKYIDKDGEKELDENSDVEFFDENGELKQNLLIKGNNLLALHALKEKLTGQVKLIYIDPPYNTGSDGFKYNDSFNHSSWLVFMKNRLEAAKELLSESGVIFISCDDNEQAYLRVLCDEIFGKQNFVANFVWQKKTSGSQHSKHVLDFHEYILAFAKDITRLPAFKAKRTAEQEASFKYKDEFINERGKYLVSPLKSWLNYRRTLIYPIKAPDGSVLKTQWVCSQKTYNELLADGRIEFRRSRNGDWSVYKKQYITDRGGEVMPPSILLNSGLSANGTREVKTLFNKKAFPNPKPEKLISDLMYAVTNEQDIVLDFCLGSGTTAAVAHKMNRRWIGIEQMDYIENVAKERLKKVIDGEQGGVSQTVNWHGGGSFVYCELKKYNQDFIDRIMEAITASELEEVYKDMQKNAFLKFFFDKNEFEKDENFRSKSLDERKELLVGILDENQFYLNLSEMNDTKYKVTDAERVLTEKFYQIKEDEVENAEE